MFICSTAVYNVLLVYPLYQFNFNTKHCIVLYTTVSINKYINK